MNDRHVWAGSPVFPQWGDRAISFFALLLLAVVGSCTRAPAAPSKTGGVQRIVSVVPSATEVLIALGAGQRIVARTSFDRDTIIAAVPSLGYTMQPSAEAVLAFEPDLLIDANYQHSPEAARVLAGQGVRTLTTDLQTFADVHALIDTLGVLLDLRGRADSLNASLRLTIDRLSAHQPSTRPSAVYVVWPLPPRVAGGTTYVSEVLHWAGARNAFADVRDWPEITFEALVARNPDYIVIPQNRADISLAALRRLPGWKQLAAVRAGNVLEVPDQMLEHPGPRALESAALIATLLRAHGRRP